MNKLLLWLVMLPAGLYRRSGADIAQLRALLQVRLTMDDRRPMAMGARAGRKKKGGQKATTIWTAIVSFFMGCFYLLPLANIPDFAMAWVAYYTLFLFLLTLTLITDFSNVLFDTRDKYIVVPRPVNGRTIFLARFLHITIYIFRLVIPMGLPGWIAGGLIFGAGVALWFPVALLLITATTLVLVMGLYQLILVLASPARFKSWIANFQIVFSITAFSAYYLLQPMLRDTDVNALHLSRWPGLQWTPMYWTAATYSWIGHTEGFLPHASLFALLAVLVPLGLLYGTMRFLAPVFTEKLGELDGGTAEEPHAPQAVSSSRPKARGVLTVFALLFTKHPHTEAGFRIAWLQSARSRTFRMRVLPTFAYVPVYSVFLFTQNGGTIAEMWAGLPDSNRHIALLYLCAFVLMQASTYTVMSEHYKAAWLYAATPVERPGRVMGGAFVSIWVKYFLPFFLAITAFVIGVWGPKVILDVILAAVNVTLFALTMCRIAHVALPFSRAEQMKERGGRFFKTLGGMMIAGVLGGVHYFLCTGPMAGIWWLKLVFLALSSGLLWLVWDSYLRTDWLALRHSADFLSEE